MSNSFPIRSNAPHSLLRIAQENNHRRRENVQPVPQTDTFSHSSSLALELSPEEREAGITEAEMRAHRRAKEEGDKAYREATDPFIKSIIRYQAFSYELWKTKEGKSYKSKMDFYTISKYNPYQHRISITL
jgi:hypothetical protein